MAANFSKHAHRQTLPMNPKTCLNSWLHTASNCLLNEHRRFYDDILDKTVLFKTEADVSSVQKQLLTWELHFALETKGAGRVLGGQFLVQHLAKNKLGC